MKTNLPVTMQKTIFGTERKAMEIGLVKGRNILMRNGYKQCENPVYYEKDGDYWHYNSIGKYWLND